MIILSLSLDLFSVIFLHYCYSACNQSKACEIRFSNSIHKKPVDESNSTKFEGEGITFMTRVEVEGMLEKENDKAFASKFRLM